MSKYESQAWGSGVVKGQRFHTSKTFDNFQLFEQCRAETEARLKIKDKNICQLLKFTTNESKAFCGQFYKINLEYQFYDETIEQKNLSEADLVKIAQDVLNALLTFSKNKIRHGLICPETVLFNGSDYMLTDVRFLTDLYEYRLQLLGFKQKCYLSPSLLKELGRRTVNPIYNYEKSEIFSLGVTLLECAMQKCVQDIYNMDQFMINLEMRNCYLEVIQDRYSTQLAQLLSRMLEIDEYKRISAKELQQSLQSYQQGSNIKVISNYQAQKEIIPQQHNNRQVFGLQNYNSQQTQYRTPPRFATEYSEKMNASQISSQNQSAISPARLKSESDLNEKFEKFSKEMQTLQNKFSRINIPTPSTNHNQSTKEYSAEQLFPTFQPSQNLQRSTQSFHHDYSLDNSYTSQSYINKSNISKVTNHQAPNLNLSQISDHRVNHSVSYHYPQTDNSLLESQLPTFKQVTRFPHEIDVKMENRYTDSVRQIQERIQHIDLKTPPIYHSNYDDDNINASLPQSSVIHMHDGSQIFLSDFFVKR